MFDFEKLQAYQKAKEFNLKIRKELLSLRQLDVSAKYQLRRAAMSIMLNIAEGTSRFSKADKRHFYVISRGSLFECIALTDLLDSEGLITNETRLKFYALAEEISKMLFAMIRKLEKAV